MKEVEKENMMNYLRSGDGVKPDELIATFLKDKLKQYNPFGSLSKAKIDSKIKKKKKAKRRISNKSRKNNR